MVIDKLIPFIVNIDEINSIEHLYDTPNSLNILDVSRDPIIYFFDGRNQAIGNNTQNYCNNNNNNGQKTY